MTNWTEATAANLAKIAEEFDRAAAHARTAAKHFEERNVPRGCAHIVAAEGHLVNARKSLDDVAKVHAAHAVP